MELGLVVDGVPVDGSASRSGVVDRRTMGRGDSDRRRAQKVTGPTFAFLLAVIASQLLIAVIGFFIGRGQLSVPGRHPLLTTGLGSAAVALVVTGAILAGLGYAATARRSNLTLSVLMALVGFGWLLPLIVLGENDLNRHVLLAPLAFGTAFSILGVTVLAAWETFRPLKLPVTAVFALAGAPILCTIIATLVRSDGLGPDPLGGAALPAMTFAAIIAMAVGFSSDRWLLVFVGLQTLGVELSEVFAAQGRVGADVWFVGASLVAFGSGAIGLYGVVADVRLRSLSQLAKFSAVSTALGAARQDAEVQRVSHQNRMHSLSSGLLAVEALVSYPSLSADVGETVALEVRRLRELATGVPLIFEDYELVTGLRALVEIQHRRGVAISLDAPEVACLRGASEATIDAVHLLIDNAIRHAPGSPILVAAQYVEGVEWMEISVSDRGSGVPEKMQSKIFKRGVTSHDEGSGIGLDVARRIAVAHGGELSYRDRLGGGATFVFRILVAPGVGAR